MEENNNDNRNDNRVEIIKIQKDIHYILKVNEEIKDMVHELKENLRKEYVTKIEFTPVKNIAFGLAGAVLLSVIGAILSVIMGVVR